jgi:hypothetical protein
MVPCRALIRKHLSLLKPGEIFTTRDLLSYGRRSAVDKTLVLMVQSGYLTRLAYGVFVVSHTSKPFYTVAEIVERKALAFGKVLYIHGSNFKIKQSSRIKIKIHSSKVVQGAIGPAQGVSAKNESTQALTLTGESKGESKDEYRGEYKGQFRRRYKGENQAAATKSEQFLYSCSTSSSSFRFRCGPARKIDLAMVRYCCTKLLKYGDSNVGLTIRGLVSIGAKEIDDEIVQGALDQLHFKEQEELRMASAWMPHWLANRLITLQSAIASALRFQRSRTHAGASAM